MKPECRGQFGDSGLQARVSECHKPFNDKTLHSQGLAEAEREGFEPSIQSDTPYNGLANRRLQPLGHLSGEGLEDSRALGRRPIGVPACGRSPRYGKRSIAADKAMANKRALTYHAARQCFKETKFGKTYYLPLGQCPRKSNVNDDQIALAEWRCIQSRLLANNQVRRILSAGTRSSRKTCGSPCNPLGPSARPHMKLASPVVTQPRVVGDSDGKPHKNRPPVCSCRPHVGVAG